MAANDSYPKSTGADEFKVAKFKEGYKAFVDADKGWQYTSNPNYNHNEWYSTPDNAWEGRLGATPFDQFEAFNHNKLPNKPGEWYSPDKVPILDPEFDEVEYWKTAPKAKTAEQLADELDQPRQALEKKYEEIVAAAPEHNKFPVYPMWTPAMAMMVAELPQGRKLNFELAPFFQLNSKGYRKNWANTPIAQYRPFQRYFSNNYMFLEDYMVRFQLQRVRMTGRPRFAVFKAYLFVSILTCFSDMMWCHEYRVTRKWH